jgi:hypothetical protein
VRWDVKDVTDERDQSSLGDIGVHEFDAYSGFPDGLMNAVLSTLQEVESFEPEKFYSLRVSLKDGGTEIGQSTAHFFGKNLQLGDSE